MLVSDFDFVLPEELVAQQPPARRGDSRMLLLDRGTGRCVDSAFQRFPAQLRPGDVLVLNDSRVVPARLYGTRMPRDGEAGIFYVRLPGATKGQLIGILLRHFPRIVGDGVRSIAELIAAVA